MKEAVQKLLLARQYAAIRALLGDLNPADAAGLLEELEPHERLLVFRLLTKELAAETFVELESDTRSALIRSFSDSELKDVLDELFLDDAVDLIEEMPANVVKRILQHADPEMRRGINELLKYPSDSAGSIMTIEFVDLKTTMTVEDAFLRIRRTGPDKETIYTCYVIDDNRHLLGLVTVQTLLLSDPQALIGDIMDTHCVEVGTLEDQEVVAQTFSRYNLLALPVVDGEHRLVGIVTVDDALDVLEEETTEDIEKMAAITPTDKPYLKTGVFETWRKRVPWLMVLMITATITGKIIQSFESALAAQVALTAFIPMLMDTGGNAGSQASVSIIRGLSLGEIRLRDIGRIVFKEFRVALLCGVVLAAANLVKMMLIDRVTLTVAMVVSVTMMVTVLLAKLVGCSLPVLAKRIGFDPAVMASPFVTSIVDALSLLVYFNIATAVLKL